MFTRHTRQVSDARPQDCAVVGLGLADAEVLGDNGSTCGELFAISTTMAWGRYFAAGLVLDEDVFCFAELGDESGCRN